MDDKPLHESGFDSSRICINCPVCFRTIWNGAVCHHGNVPEPRKAEASEEQEEYTHVKNQKRERRQRGTEY